MQHKYLKNRKPVATRPTSTFVLDTKPYYINGQLIQDSNGESWSSNQRGALVLRQQVFRFDSQKDFQQSSINASNYGTNQIINPNNNRSNDVSDNKSITSAVHSGKEIIGSNKMIGISSVRTEEKAK